MSFLDVLARLENGFGHEIFLEPGLDPTDSWTTLVFRRLAFLGAIERFFVIKIPSMFLAHMNFSSFTKLKLPCI